MSSKPAKTAKPDAIALMGVMNQKPAAQDNAPPRAAKKAAASPAAAKVASTRRNTKLIAGHFPEATHKALRLVAAEDGITMQQILEEALHDWLVKKGATKHLNK